MNGRGCDLVVKVLDSGFEPHTGNFRHPGLPQSTQL